MRARMRLRVTCATQVAKQKAKPAATKMEAGHGEREAVSGGTVKDRILSYFEAVESQDTGGGGAGEWEVVGFVEPGAFKGLGEFVAGETKGKGRVEVLDAAVTHEDDS
jgi:ribosome maturation protein SDO1